MPTKRGDLYIVVPDPALRRAIRSVAALDDVPMRALIRDFLISGLAARGITVPESPLVAAPETNTQRERVNV